MQQLNLQLYGKTAKSNFNEQLSTSKTVPLGPEPTTVELELAAPKGEEFIELRIDPDDKPSRFALLDMSVRSRNGTELYRWNRDSNGFQTIVALQTSVVFDRAVLESTSNDPFVIIPLPTPQPSVVLEVSLSSDVFSLDQHELADAVLSLQSTLRAGLDDLAEEQEGLEATVTLNQAHARAEAEAANRKVAQIEQSLRQLQSDLGAIELKLATTAGETRNEVLSEVRDLWRSLRRQMEDGVDSALRERHEREAANSASVQREFDKLNQAVHRLASSQALLNEIRNELGVTRDVDALAKLQQLKAETQAARERSTSTLSARLARPLRSLTRALTGA